MKVMLIASAGVLVVLSTPVTKGTKVLVWWADPNKASIDLFNPHL